MLRILPKIPRCSSRRDQYDALGRLRFELRCGAERSIEYRMHHAVCVAPPMSKGHDVHHDGPLTVAVCGATGTGKSQLAVELARHIQDTARKGAVEIISADSMQMYRGLDVITNKVTEAEMAGVRHHMLSELDPAAGQECDVTTFVKRAGTIVQTIHAQQGVPIVVGGTSYYLQHLLLPGGLIAVEQEEVNSATMQDIETIILLQGQTLTEEQRAHFRTFSQTASQGSDACALDNLTMWQLLRALDPAMASRWHVRDHRKVHRSLSVLLETGRRHSDIIAEQHQQAEEQRRKLSQTSARPGVEKVVFWLCCDPDVLRPRLDARVEKMVEQGLLREIVEMRRIAASLQRQTGKAVEHSRGIFQTIGYKEFTAYLDHIDGDLNKRTEHLLRPNDGDEQAVKLFEQALDEMKTATRQYAKRQVSWLRNKLVPALRSADGQGVRVVLLDGSDLSRWTQDVSQPAVRVIDAVLNGSELDPTIGLSLPVQNEGTDKAVTSDRQHLLGFDPCPICSSDEAGSEPYMVMRSQWDMHTRGRVHRAAMHRRGLLQRRGPDLSDAAMARRAVRQAQRGSPGSARQEADDV